MYKVSQYPSTFAIASHFYLQREKCMQILYELRASYDTIMMKFSKLSFIFYSFFCFFIILFFFVDFFSLSFILVSTVFIRLFCFTSYSFYFLCFVLWVKLQRAIYILYVICRSTSGMHGTIEFVKRIHNYSNYYSNSTHEINLSIILCFFFTIYFG